MTETDIKSIEDQLKISLPLDYKQVVLDYPFSEDPRYAVARIQILNDPEKVISLNLELRKNGFRKRKWPDNLFAFGTLLDAIYFYDLNNLPEIFSVSNDSHLRVDNIQKNIDRDNIHKLIKTIKFLAELTASK